MSRAYVFRLLNRLQSFPTLFRWLIAIAYTILLTITLIQPSRTPLIGPAAPLGPPDAAREVFLTAMHVLGFTLLVVIVWWAFESVTPARRALWVALGFALVFSPLTEFLQMLVPGRGASLWDWGVNTLATLTAAMVWWRVKSRRP
jgi:VanZ family protein